MPRLPSSPAAMMADLHRTGKDRCLLCGRRPFVMAVWLPTADACRKLGVPAGEVRSVGYCLCKKCHRRPDWTSRAEERILAEAAALLALPAAN